MYGLLVIVFVDILCLAIGADLDIDVNLISFRQNRWRAEEDTAGEGVEDTGLGSAGMPALTTKSTLDDTV